MYMMMTAVQCLGGVPLPLYQDAVASEMLFVLLDAEVRFIFVEDQEQVDKVLEIQDQLPLLETSALRRCARHAPLHVAVHPRHPRVDGDGAVHNRNHPDLLATRSPPVPPMMSASCSTPLAPPASRRVCG
jgi:long-chain acyl-CoA synthetase